MNKVESVYKERFFRDRHKLSWRAPYVGQALIDTFLLESGNSVADIGCAIGDYVLWLKEHGIQAIGVEGSEEARKYFVTDGIFVLDLRMDLPITKGCKVDVAFSLEVAEHIEPEFSDIYVSNLCKFSDTILISAAIPGQKGHGHVNCQPMEYWVEKFGAFGYQLSPGLMTLWVSNLSHINHRKELHSYCKNVMIFKKVLGA